jgi:hypothetical protein
VRKEKKTGRHSDVTGQLNHKFDRPTLQIVGIILDVGYRADFEPDKVRELGLWEAQRSASGSDDLVAWHGVEREVTRMRAVDAGQNQQVKLQHTAELPGMPQLHQLAQFLIVELDVEVLVSR